MASNYGELIRWADSPRKEVVMYTVHFVENKDGYWWVVEIHGTDHFFPRATPSESYRLRDRLNAAQQSAHLTALRRVLAVSIFINVILLAVILFTIGGR